MATATRQAVLCEWCKKPLRRNSTDGLNITYGDINAAEQRGIEIEERYAELAANRMAQTVMQL